MGTKIFGIGLNKTGTTTLNKCGQILGYQTLSCKRDLLEDVVLRNDFSQIIKWVERYDLFEDWPWPLIYRNLDQMFPGSKFVLTIRKDSQIWLKSLKKHSLSTHPHLHCRKLAYGYNYPHSNEKFFIEFYNNHNNQVRNYFKGRENDFIELCWEKGNGWDDLCEFLNVKTPNVPLPHENKAIERHIPLGTKFVNRLLSIVRNK